MNGLHLPLADPAPAATDEDTLASGSSLNSAVAWAVIGIFLLLFGAALYLARAILVPFTAATIIAMTLAPLARRAERHHVPPWLFAIVAIAVLVAVIQASTFLFLDPISKWIERAPELGGIVKNKLHAIDDVRGFKIDLSTFVEPVLGSLTPAISQLVIFFAMLFFLLIGQQELRRNLILVFSGKERRLHTIRILNEIEEGLARYVATVCAINFVLGLLASVGASIIGLPNPVVWGVLAFLSNFVPYIGPAFVLCVLFGVGLINFSSLGYALIMPAYYLALTTLEGHFITPNIVGKRFTLSPLVVFLALVFWTWIWGPIGGFVAIPILIASLIIFNEFFSADAALPD